jgi:HEAT repeat protein
LRALSASVDASRLEYTVRLLGELGDPASVPRLLDLTRHRLHFVRWAAVRAVLSIEPGRAVEVLTAAAADRHPHVRRAAERSLQQIERRVHSGTHL